MLYDIDIKSTGRRESGKQESRKTGALPSPFVFSCSSDLFFPQRRWHSPQSRVRDQEAPRLDKRRGLFSSPAKFGLASRQSTAPPELSATSGLARADRVRSEVADIGSGWIRVERPTWPSSAATCRRASAPMAHLPEGAFPAHLERRASHPPRPAVDPFHPDIEGMTSARHGHSGDRHCCSHPGRPRALPCAGRIR